MVAGFPLYPGRKRKGPAGPRAASSACLPVVSPVLLRSGISGQS